MQVEAFDAWGLFAQRKASHPKIVSHVCLHPTESWLRRELAPAIVLFSEKVSLLETGNLSGNLNCALPPLGVIICRRVISARSTAHIEKTFLPICFCRTNSKTRLFSGTVVRRSDEWH